MKCVYAFLRLAILSSAFCFRFREAPCQFLCLAMISSIQSLKVHPMVPRIATSVLITIIGVHVLGDDGLMLPRISRYFR